MLDKLTDAATIALRCPADAWPRGLISDPPIPDAWMGLVICADGRRWLAPAGEPPRGARGDTLVLVRNRPIAAPVAVRGASSADRHSVDADVELLVRCPMREDDLAAFHATLLHDDTLSLAALEHALRAAGAVEALRAFVASQPASRLVHEDQRGPLIEHLRTALRPFLFRAGLELERIGAAAFTSATLRDEESHGRDVQRRTREIESRRRVEDAALAATQRRVEGLGAVFEKLKQLEQAGAGRWRDLLPALTPSERGRLLENLWRLTPDRRVAEAIVVVAGVDVTWLDPDAPDRIVERVSLPGDLGGLRSISCCEQTGELLVGAARGVWRLGGGPPQRLDVPLDTAPTTGFNAAIRAGSRIIAAHSQLGCWVWPDGGAPVALIDGAASGAATIRSPQVADDGSVLVAVDDAIRVFNNDLSPARTLEIARGAVTGLAIHGDQVFATTADGLVLADNWRSPNVWRVLHRGRASIESIDLRRWDDLVELVVPAGHDGVLGVYDDAGVAARLMHPPAPVRRVRACDDALAALTVDRDRLFVQRPDAAAPLESPLARLTGRTVQDVAVVVKRMASGE